MQLYRIHWRALVFFWWHLQDFLCIVSCHLQTVTSSFPIWIFKISVSFLLPIVRTSNTVLNRSGKSGHPCLVPHPRGNTFTFSPLIMMWTVSLLCMAIMMLRYVPSIPTLWRLFFIINRCWILWKAFSASIEMIIWFLFFSLLMLCITLIDSWILNHPCIPGINPTWSWFMILFKYCWIQFANILLRIFACIFISDTGL